MTDFFKQREKINVVYKNGVKDRISPALLGILIKSKQINQFERSSGWCQVGIDTVRGTGNSGFSEADRRMNDSPI